MDSEEESSRITIPSDIIALRLSIRDKEDDEYDGTMETATKTTLLSR